MTLWIKGTVDYYDLVVRPSARALSTWRRIRPSARALPTWRRERPSARALSTWRRERPSARTVDNSDLAYGPSIITTAVIREVHGNYEPHGN